MTILNIFALAIGACFGGFIGVMYAIYEDAIIKKLKSIHKANKAKKVSNNHSVDGYFKLCEENDYVCHTSGNFHNYNLDFNSHEIVVGVAVMVVFFAVLAFIA